MKKSILILIALLTQLFAVTAFAAQMRLFVADINVTGGQDSAEMKRALQVLLTSRLNGDKIVTVASAAEADVVVSGTYVSFGKIFSIDTIAKTPAGKTISQAFVQGATGDELIPAIGILAGKLTAELTKSNTASGVVVTAPLLLTAVSETEIVKPKAQETAAASGWMSPRLTGAANLIATGRTLPDGNREIFLAEEQQLAYYRQGIDMKLIAEVILKPTEKILSLDTIAGNDGNFDIYVTIIRADELASQVWQVKGDTLQLVAEKIPYFFRCANLFGGATKLYAQSMGRGDDFYGDVAEASRIGSAITLSNPIKMPRYGNIYSFNQFRNINGKTFTIVLNPDGYLIVYDQQLNELWRSNDKFGGSELYFQKEDSNNIRVSGDKYRWTFLNQRIQVTSKGEILIGKNDGFWVMGNARSYKRGAVYNMIWNGSSLDEKWRTRETQNYMPDYLYNESRNELLILQTVQRPGLASRGASSLSIKKVE